MGSGLELLRVSQSIPKAMPVKLVHPKLVHPLRISPGRMEIKRGLKATKPLKPHTSNHSQRSRYMKPRSSVSHLQHVWTTTCRMLAAPSSFVTWLDSARSQHSATTCQWYDHPNHRTFAKNGPAQRLLPCRFIANIRYLPIV